MKKAPVLNEKQYKSLLNATKMTRYADRNRMMVVLSYGVGLRACEIAAITVGDVLDSENNVRETVILAAHQTKGLKSHSLYLSDPVRKEIPKYIKATQGSLTVSEIDAAAISERRKDGQSHSTDCAEGSLLENRVRHLFITFRKTQFHHESFGKRSQHESHSGTSTTLVISSHTAIH